MGFTIWLTSVFILGILGLSVITLASILLDKFPVASMIVFAVAALAFILGSAILPAL